MIQTFEPERVRAAREAAGMTQADLASRVGMPTSVLADMERPYSAGGEKLRVSHILQIAAHLDTPIGAFFSDPPDADASRPSANRDADRLITLLLGAKGPATDSVIMDCLGWTLNRFTTARTHARSRLTDTGLTIHSRGGTTALIPTRPEPIPEAVINREGQDLPDQAMHLLRRIIRKPAPIHSDWSDAQRRNITILVLHGLIEERDGMLTATDDVLSNLDLLNQAAPV